MNKPKIIVVLGPTASGKTSLAIDIAKRFDGEIISADSRAIYRQMDIGTAKPPRDKRAQALARREGQKEGIKDLFRAKPYMVEEVPHWGFDLCDPDEDFSAADFQAYAEEKIKEITGRGHLPIIAGGTGLYISAIVDNLSFTEVEPDKKLRAELQDLSDQELVERLQKADSEAAKTIDTANRRRLLRAVEIVETTGQPLSAQQTKKEPKYDVLQLGLKVDREVLYERIDMRVDEMIAAGLVDEVRALRDEYGCEINSMTGIGYRQICAFLDGYLKLRDAIEVLKRDTRHYAKRQMTWFRRDGRIEWIENQEKALALVADFLK